jgi:thiol-disulfide isomerase/thioredoxin
MHAAAMRQLQWLFVVLGSAAAGCAPPPDLYGADDGAIGDEAGADDDGAATDDGTPAEGTPGVTLDLARLDRDAAGADCGYPSGGDAGYGAAVGRRFANNEAFRLVDCEGNEVTLADFFCERPAGGYNAGILVNIGAGWCAPCQEETEEFPALYEEFHAKGIEFVQVLFQDWNAQAPTGQFCHEWSDGKWKGGGPGELDLAFPVLLDQVYDWTSVYLQDPQSATPVNMLIDANGNIRWKTEGQKPDPAILRTQFQLVLDDPYGG